MAALPDTRMPGVITVEVPTLPPSVALVPTAVPVFIGYTEKHEKDGEPVPNKPVRIKSMRDYEAWFGVAFPQPIKVNVELATDGKVSVKVDSVGELNFRLYYALQLYFTNGGGPCYIISVGKYETTTTPAATVAVPAPNPVTAPTTVTSEAFTNGIEKAKKAKEITILVMPDAVALADGDYATVINAALAHCEKAINRVTIIDVKDRADGKNGDQEGDINENEKVTEHFRTNIGVKLSQKKYGAAYYPFLKTTMGYSLKDVTIDDYKTAAHDFGALDKVARTTNIKNAKEALKTATEAYEPIAAILAEIQKPANKNKKAAELKTRAQAVSKGGVLPESTKNFFDTATEGVTEIKAKLDPLLITLKAPVTTAETAIKALFADGNYTSAPLDLLETANNLIFSKIKEAISQFPVVLPPSAAIAGVYVATDFSQGVWKAPANVGLAGVVGTTVEIDDDFHADLNVDANSGKSVNAIRPYTGRGILIFGARTLAGNDLEWRYISVRRTFCFIEDAVGQAMQDFVFAPNTRDTWIKVKAMIGNFLNEIWKAGGLFGNTPPEAYQVLVGEPETMSDIDILEGRMIVDIKLRVARPAEFIILRYEHKFQANNN